MVPRSAVPPPAPAFQQMVGISARLVAWNGFFLLTRHRRRSRLVALAVVAGLVAAGPGLVAAAAGEAVAAPRSASSSAELTAPRGPAGVELVPAGAVKWGRVPLFYGRGGALAAGVIPLTVTLPGCLSLCSVPFLCAPALWLLQWALFKEQEAI